MEDYLTFHEDIRGDHGQMVIGLSGWMDGGEISTHAVNYLVQRLHADPVASLDPGPFYLDSLPGPREAAAPVRPACIIEDGLVTLFDETENTFYYSRDERLLLLDGVEPNMNWHDWSASVFAVAERVGVRRIYFIGSVAGVVPHTRDPRMYFSTSHPELCDELRELGLRPTNYEGPASIVTYLTCSAASRNMEMVNVVAEIPAYIQGANPICQIAAVKVLAALLDLKLDLSDLELTREQFERRLAEIVQKRDELLPMIEKLEGEYDNEIFDTQMGDLKEWLHQRGIRLD